MTGANGSLSAALRFDLNIPQACSLKFPSPKIISKDWGERAMFTLSDGRVMFIDLETAKAIEAMQIQVGEKFFLCKRRGGHMDIWLDPASEAARAKHEEPAVDAELRRGLEDSLAQVEWKRSLIDTSNGKRPAAPAPPPAPQSQPAVALPNNNNTSGHDTSPLAHSGWAAEIRERTQANLTLYWQLCEWAKEQFPSMQRSEVRAFLMNALISGERRGR